MKRSLEEKVKQIQIDIEYSGTLMVKQNLEMLITFSNGYANYSDKIKNNRLTRYGIASGCKLFTSIAIAQLVEAGKLTYDTKLNDCLAIDFPFFNKEITVHHILTHTSGIPDYFDEEEMDDFSEVWLQTPMYLMKRLTDFLPMFQNKSMKSAQGERFHYNNAGYILLGLIVEHVSGKIFTDYVEENIFRKAQMLNSGYFELDSLPKNTALGYIEQPDGSWKTNIYSVPIKGGADGGAFVTVEDMINLWEALINNKLLGKEQTDLLLSPHTHVKNNTYYGYGIWINRENDDILKYHIMGYDPGVSFHSAYYPKQKCLTVVCSNISTGAFQISKGIEEEILVSSST